MSMICAVEVIQVMMFSGSILGKCILYRQTVAHDEGEFCYFCKYPSGLIDSIDSIDFIDFIDLRCSSAKKA